MKRLLFLLLALPLASIAQEGDLQLVSHTLTIEQIEERIHDVDIEMKKAQRDIKKNEKVAAQRNKKVDAAERDLGYNEKQQAENVKRAAELKTEMRGKDLPALEKKIKDLNGDRRKLTNKNQRNSSAIVRKKAQIEKLLGEIAMLETEIDANEIVINEKTRNIDDTSEIITSNGLVEKTKELNSLDKELRNLKSKNTKLRETIAKSRNEGQSAEDQTVAQKEKLEKLRQEKATLNAQALSPVTEN